MAKAAVAAQAAAAANTGAGAGLSLGNMGASVNINDSLAEMKKSEILGNELMEGTIAIAASKRPLANNNNNPYVSRMRNKIKLTFLLHFFLLVL